MMPVWSLLILPSASLLSSPAAADDLLLYRGSPAAAVARVGGESTPWELDPVEIDGLYTARGARLLGAEEIACRGAATTAATIRDTVAAAEARLNYAEYHKALDTLTPGIDALGCLSEPAEASVSGRLFLLAGIAAVGVGDEATAARHFARVAHFQPGLPYDERLPPVAQALYQRVREAPALKIRLRAAPGVREPIWLDGRALPPGEEGVEVTAGRHLIQILGAPIRTIEADLQREAVLLGAFDAATWEAPSPLWGLIAAAAGAAPQDRVFVVSGGGAWVSADAGWRAVSAQAKAEGGGARLPAALIASGATASALGGASLATGWIWGRRHVDDAASGGAAEYEALTDAYFASERWMGASGALLGVGLATLGVGIALDVRDARIGLIPGPTPTIALSGRY